VNDVSHTLKGLIAVTAATLAGAGAAAPAQAAPTWTAPNCYAVQSADGHALYPASCSTAAPGSHWQLVVTSCGTSTCRTTSTALYRQGTTAPRFWTAGWITRVYFQFWG
jgi:hypothetical protein